MMLQSKKSEKNFICCLNREVNVGQSFEIDNYAKDGGSGVVCPPCSFYHDHLRY